MCPDTPDDGTDSDGDYVPDACDDCPCDPDEVDPWTDGDKDGVCGLACGSDGPVRLDNCPNVHNPLQENCNAEAEAARSALPLGDACDPVPCPAFSFQHDEFESVGIRVVGGGYVGCTEETLRGKLDAITLSPVGSHGAPDTPEGTRGVEVPVTPDWTEYRYCVDNADLNLDCSNPSNIKDNLIRARTSRSAEQYEDVWRRIWIEELDPPAVGSLGVANPADTGIVYRNGTVVTRHWNWLQDFTYWSQAFPQHFSVPTSPVDGRLWAHAQTTIGMTAPASNPLGTGMHPRQDQPNQPADMLANHLRDMSPHFDRVKRTCWTTHEIWKLGPLARPCPGCPDGAPLFEDPRDDCPNCGALAPLEAGDLLDAQQLVVLPSSKGTLVGVLDADGSIAPVEARLGKMFAASLSTDAMWLSAVEPNPMLGRGAVGPGAVQLSPDGTTVIDQLFVRKHRAFSQRDLGVEIPAPTGNALAGSTAGPAPRRGALGVYARSSGEVFVLGGTHAVTGAALQDIWWRGIDEGAAWKQISTRGYRPGKVLAATRSYQDRKLWVLDEVAVGMGRFARLVRITPGTGQVEEVGRWSMSGLFDSHWLVLDQDGSVLVAASSRRLRKHGIVRIRADRNGAKVDRVLMGTGALGMAPWVDASGYALPIWQSSTKLPKVVRRATLGGSMGTWRDVGQCF
jgi:hypothetical protein